MKTTNFLKGFLMGTCDIIPGISGGTIAFIIGIYQRLIEAVKGFSYKTFKNKEFKKLDLEFLAPLFLGIITAIFLMSKVMSYLLKNYFVYTISFFIGIILTSSQIIFTHIKNHKLKNILFGVFGLIVGILLAFVVPLHIAPSLPYTFLGGFLGITAMFLPGISGAFILLIMGLYEFMIQAISDIANNISYLTAFAIGLVSGAFVISRVISFIFKKDKCKTLYFLLGLVVGALSIPLRNLINRIETFNATSLLIILSFFLSGIFLVLLINMLANKNGIKKTRKK